MAGDITSYRFVFRTYAPSENAKAGEGSDPVGLAHVHPERVDDGFAGFPNRSVSDGHIILLSSSAETTPR